MKITNFDTDLILHLLREEEASTTELAYLLFAPKDDYELRKLDSKIRYRLERMRKQEMLHKNGVKYKVNEERVFLTPANLRLVDIDTEVGLGTMLVVFPKDDEIMMRQISFETLQKNRVKISEKGIKAKS